MKRTIAIVLLVAVVVVLFAGSALAKPEPMMSGSVEMRWTPTDVRYVSWEASGTLEDGDGWIRIEDTEGHYLNYEVTHFNLIDKRLGACWGVLTSTNWPYWELHQIVIWAQDQYRGTKEKMHWTWHNLPYMPACLESLYFPYDPGYGTEPELAEPLSGYIKVK